MEQFDGYPKIIFPAEFDARSEFEMSLRGYLSDGTVEDENGNQYSVFFIHPVRLQQELSDLIRLGEPCFAEPGTIVLPEITVEAVTKAVRFLWKQGFFDHLKPLERLTSGDKQNIQ